MSSMQISLPAGLPQPQSLRGRAMPVPGSIAGKAARNPTSVGDTASLDRDGPVKRATSALAIEGFDNFYQSRPLRVGRGREEAALFAYAAFASPLTRPPSGISEYV